MFFLGRRKGFRFFVLMWACVLKKGWKDLVCRREMLIIVFNVIKNLIIISISIKINYCIKSMYFSIKFVEKYIVEFFYYLWNVKVYEWGYLLL